MTRLYVLSVFALAAILFIVVCQRRADFARAAGLSAVDLSNPQNRVDALRALGPKGLETVLAKYEQNHDSKLIPVINAVAGQYDAIWSRLYWYTDLKKAEAAAEAQHKPILYLRLLGKLTDEYSCANSRFFRTILYGNAEVSSLLREQFILVWCSERPVPAVSIDFGDGRVMKRTITGNSIHYILDCRGRVVDAVPGIYGPAKFMDILRTARQAALDVSDDDSRQRFWSRSQAALFAEWAHPPDIAPKFATRDAAAVQASRIGVSKNAVEWPLLMAISPEFSSEMAASIDGADSTTWLLVARDRAGEAILDEHSIEMIRSQNPIKYADPAALQQTVERFQSLIAQDMVQNNFKFRRQILAWLSAGRDVQLEGLNRRVYSQLFLTPRSDPWLGMAPESEYTGLTNDGICAAQH